MSKPRPVLGRAGSVVTPVVTEPVELNPPTSSELKERRSAIEAELRTLATQREALALKALSGDDKASTVIASIDAERQKLAAQIETINQGLRTLATAPRKLTIYDLPGSVQAMGVTLTPSGYPF